MPPHTAASPSLCRVGIIDASFRSGSPVATWPLNLSNHRSLRIDTSMSSLVIRAPAHTVMRKPPSPVPAAPGGISAEAKALSQFYTKPELAKRYYYVFCKLFGSKQFQFVEPSAGSGTFLRVLPVSSFACDIAPATAGIFQADFLKLGIHCSLPTVCIGNPPFGKNCDLAIRFFNHAASFSQIIAFILPRTFRKASKINKLNDTFHLIHEETVPDGAFIFKGAPRSVPTVFQIWVRRKDYRARIPEIRTHPDFTFMPAEEAEHADFAMQRVGKDAGRVHHDLWRSHKAHYFIKGDVEHIMKELRPAFAEVASNTVGKPSLAMSEIVDIYSDRIAKGRKAAD